MTKLSEKIEQTFTFILQLDVNVCYDEGDGDALLIRDAYAIARMLKLVDYANGKLLFEQLEIAENKFNKLMDVRIPKQEDVFKTEALKKDYIFNTNLCLRDDIIDILELYLTRSSVFE